MPMRLGVRSTGLIAILAPASCVLALAAQGPGDSRPATSAGRAAGDEPDREHRHETARALVRDNCLICHSEELLSSQKLTHAQWKAEVEKMVGWGTPLSAEQVAPVVDFLAEAYADSTPARPPARITYEQAQAQVGPEPSARAVSGD